MSNRIVEAQDESEVLESDEVLVDLDEKEVDDIEEVDEKDKEGESKSKSEADDKDEDEFDLPEKFKGKTLKDVVEAYTNLEKDHGRKSNEIGQLRKSVDQLLDLERLKKEPKEEAPDVSIDADSLLENPQEAIAKVLENDPTIKAVKETLSENQKATKLKDFEDSHPDWKEVMGSEQFLTWIEKSPARLKMLKEADANYDYSTGGELIDEFKELYPAKSAEEIAAEQAEEEEKLEQDHKALTTEKKSKSKGSRRKIYSRKQIVDLAVNNPVEYERRKEEFDKAYLEGRVR